ncbi:MAG TPA: ABC transporter permease, partial [Bryobacteraceae bacterium]|nr:ABC transporter permease [Bryobacteraceae bacterium]
MRTLLQDFKYGARTYSKTPGFTLAAMVTLALGIGATATVFSIADAILLKPLPYPDFARIVIPWRQVPKRVNLGFHEYPWDRASFLEFAAQTKTFEAMGAFKSGSFNLTGADGPVRIDGVLASVGFLPSLGVEPALGRNFTAEEDSPGHELEVILGDQLWRERFHADPNIIGQSIDMNARRYTVIGVMPPGFVFPRAAEMPPVFNFPHEGQLWVPLALEPGPLKPAEPWEIAVLGRLRRNISIEQAQAELDVFARIVEKRFPGGLGWYGTRIRPLADQTEGETRRPLILLLGAVGVVLLIACSNVGGLLLARALARSHEFALRAALGAERSRLMSQIAMETVPLSLAGGAAGLLLARALVEFVKAFGPVGIPRLQEASIDWRVVAFAFAVTLAAGILSSLAPAMASARKDLADTLKEGGRRTTGGGFGTRKALLVSQTALALVLTMAAGLLTESFVRLLHVNPGFRADHVLTFEVSIPNTKYPDNDRIVALYNKVLAALRATPGVEAAGIGEVVPMGGAPDNTGIRIPGRVRDPLHPQFADYNFVSSD